MPPGAAATVAPLPVPPSGAGVYLAADCANGEQQRWQTPINGVEGQHILI